MRKEDDVSNRSLVREQHDEAIDADAFPGGRRHAIFQRAQKIFVHAVSLFVAGFMPRGLRLEALSLIEGII